MVQLGVFSIQANAERLAQELKSQGFHALVSENGGGGRPLWRVRAGPVSERAAAEQLSAKLRAAGHAGSIVRRSSAFDSAAHRRAAAFRWAALNWTAYSRGAFSRA